MRKSKTAILKVVPKQVAKTNEIIINKPIIHEKYIDNGDLHDDNLIDIKLTYNKNMINNKEFIVSVNKIVKEHNITIKLINDDHIDINGTVKNISNLFNTTIKEFKDGDNIYYSNITDIKIPKELNHITNVMGLNNMPIFTPYSSEKKTIRAHAKNLNLTSFTPIQIANLYNFPSYTGKNQTIAIIELGGGYKQSDMDYYFGSNGLNLSKAPTIIPISIGGATNNPSDTSGANYEVVLDIQIAGAIANESTILVYFAPNTDSGFYNAIYAAINDTVYRPSVISISWGAPERYWSSSTLISYNNLFATAIPKNINIFAASGDNGSSGGAPGINADFPSSSPNVISCGGTSLNATASAIQSETVWNRNGGVTGGGYSRVFNKPSYQRAITGTKRGVPDVTGNADPYTGYTIYIDGAYTTIGGTSAVSPLYAGLAARLNQSKNTNLRFLNSQYFYPKRSTFCVDILSGTNGAYKASTGWDPCSGNGRINGKNIIANL